MKATESLQRLRALATGPRRWIVILLALGGLIAVALAFGPWLRPKVVLATVAQRDFVQTVVASGHVETPHRVAVGSQLTGTVARIPVAEGQPVRQGDLLIELESTELQAAVRQADVAVAQAQAQLRQLVEVQRPVARQALRQAQTTLDNARAQQRRAEDLHRQGFIGMAALDDARKAAELADAQARTAQEQLESLGDRGSQRALSDAGLGVAQANAAGARARLGHARIHAAADGLLIGRDVEVGDVVQPGKVLMTLSPAGRVQLVVDIDEKNLHLLAVGQKALASTDAYPRQRFDAVLAYINPGVNAQTGSVEVKFDVPSPPALLKQDMTVSVDIEVGRRPQALVLPSEAVRDAEGRSPWVLRLEQGDRAVRREVRLGLRSGGFTEVLEGLRSGDAVVLGSAVQAGARVRRAAAQP